MAGDSELSVDERAHAAKVKAHLANVIRVAGDWISFEQFMEIALYAPALGYYSAGARKLGAGGDFTTAPEISGLFGACLARQCADVLRGVERGSILEIGAGTGRLAVDVLARLEGAGQLPVRYAILEVSPDLRERQRALLSARVPHLMERVEWLNAPPREPYEGVVFANEVLDALPVARFRWSGEVCSELGVAFASDRFIWEDRPAGEALAARCRTLAAVAESTGNGAWDDGYVSEYCPRLDGWTRSVTQSLERGLVLWLDYGLPRSQYYMSERHDGTLLCHFRHRAHDDPFLHPGLQDITAWVDFTAVAEASRGTGFEVAGFTTQAYFLAGLGIDEEMQVLAGGEDKSFARLANQARQLMLPGEMGERFKAMAWSRGIDIPLSGFALQDLRHTL